MKWMTFILAVVLAVAGAAITEENVAAPTPPTTRDLPDVLKAGVLRHLGVPYAHFVTGAGDGLDVELVKLFAQKLGVKYEYVAVDWKTAIPGCIGRQVAVKNGKVELGDHTPVLGDMIANGMTVLGWRKEVLDFSAPTFPTQVWLIARADSDLKPIKATDLKSDIAAVKAMLKDRVVLGKSDTCLEPTLYNLADTQAKIKMFAGGLNDLAPAVIEGVAETSLLDVPDSLVALEKWPGKIKVIGPVCEPQQMAAAFPKGSPQLREAFDAFFAQCRKDGTYDRLVRKYYPAAFTYYPEFFAAPPAQDAGAKVDSNK